MRRFSLAKIAVVLIAFLAATSPASAQQGQLEGKTFDVTNLRAGPGREFPVLAVLGAGAPARVEGRNAAVDWLLVTAEGSARGWLKAKLLVFAAPVSLRVLPVRKDVIERASVPGAPEPDQKPGAAVTNPARYAAQITPAVRVAMKAIFARGRALGNNPRVFAKVGDCHAGGAWFLYQFGDGQPNDLGQYGFLQNAVRYFSASPRPGVPNPFVTISQAQHGNFTTAAVLDPIWADPKVCQAGESPLACEFRIDKPAAAIIIFGIVDVHSGFTAEQFAGFTRRIVDETLDRGIIPILSTAPETHNFLGKIRQFNQIIGAIALEKKVPLINLAEALSGLPNRGVDPDGIHLTPALKFTRASFTHLTDGFAVWNYLALQTLYNVWQQVMN